MDKDVRLSWERFLNPELLRTNLIIASLYITSFEILNDSIVTRIKDFFTNGFKNNEWTIDEEYNIKVLSLNKSPLYASLEWLKNMNAINDEDINNYNEIKNYRNELAHEIPNFITKGSKIDPLPLFGKLVELLNKIEKWWILNVEIPINSNLDGEEINEAEIVPGPVISIQLMMDIALGSEQESKYYYNEFVKRNKSI